MFTKLRINVADGAQGRRRHSSHIHTLWACHCPEHISPAQKSYWHQVRAMPPRAMPEDPMSWESCPEAKPTVLRVSKPHSPGRPEEGLPRLTLWLRFCSQRSCFFKDLAEITSKTDLLNAKEKPTRIHSPGAGSWH